MSSVKETAQVLSVLVPKVMTGIKGSLMLNEDVTTQQMITIMTIGGLGQCKVGKLSRRMGVSPPTITGLVDRLERTGYVERTRDVSDRRLVLVCLTKKGQGFVGKFKKTVERRWTKILVHLTDEERGSYIKILRKINTVLEREHTYDGA